MNKNEKTRRLTGISILTGMVIALQIISNYITIGSVSITLSLIPIVIGAIIFGPLWGAFLGFINGIIVLFAPSTLSLFFSLHPFPTILICLTKTTIAGLLSGYIYLLFKKRDKLGAIFASISVPIINTALFCVGALIFFNDLLSSFINEGWPNIYAVLFIGFVGINFIIEFLVNFLLSGAVYTIIEFEKNKIKERTKIGEDN